MSKSYELRNDEKEVIEMIGRMLEAIKTYKASSVNSNEEDALSCPSKEFFKDFVGNLSDEGLHNLVKDRVTKLYEAEEFCCPELIVLANGESLNDRKARETWFRNEYPPIKEFLSLENKNQIEWEMHLAINDVVDEREKAGVVFPEIMVNHECFLQRYESIKKDYLKGLEIVPFAKDMFALLKDLNSILLLNGNMIESWLDNKTHESLRELFINILKDKEVPVIEVVGEEVFEQESQLNNSSRYKRKTIKMFNLLSIMLGDKVVSKGASTIVDDCLGFIKDLPEMSNNDKKNLFCISLLSRMDNYVMAEKKAVQKTLKGFVKEVLSFETLDKKVITIDYDENNQVAKLLFDIKRWQLGVYMFSLGILPSDKEKETLNYTKLLGDSLVMNDYLEFWRNNRNFLPTEKLVRFSSKAIKEIMSDVEVEPSLSGTNTFVSGKYGDIILTFKNIKSKEDLGIIENVMKKMLYLPVDCDDDYEKMVVPFIDELMMKMDIKQYVEIESVSSKKIRKF